MNRIHLTPKYEKIQKELYNNNKDPFKTSKYSFNIIVKQQATMIAQGLQLAEEYSEDNGEQLRTVVNATVLFLDKYFSFMIYFPCNIKIQGG